MRAYHFSELYLILYNILINFDMGLMLKRLYKRNCPSVSSRRFGPEFDIHVGVLYKRIYLYIFDLRYLICKDERVKILAEKSDLSITEVGN